MGTAAGAGGAADIIISSSNNFGGVCLLTAGTGLLALLLLELSEASTRGKPPAAADELSEDEVEGGSSLGGDSRNAAKLCSCGFLWLLIMGRGCACCRGAASTTVGLGSCSVTGAGGATIGGSLGKDAIEDESDCGISIL